MLISPIQDFEKKNTVFDVLNLIRKRLQSSILKMEAGHFPARLIPTNPRSAIRYKNITLIHKEAWLFPFFFFYRGKGAACGSLKAVMVAARKGRGDGMGRL